MQRGQALGGGVRTYGLTLGLQPSQVHCELLPRAGAFRSMLGLAGRVPQHLPRTLRLHGTMSAVASGSQGSKELP